jgi:OmpA-OmpF porin, OOP family
MRRLSARLALFAVVAVAGFLGPATWAQNREKAWEINPYGGYMYFSKVQGQQALNNTWDIGFRFGYNWTKHHEVEFGFFGASTNDGEGLDLSIDLLGGQVNYDYNFFLQRRGRIVGFGTAGLGIMNVSTFGFVSDPNAVGDNLSSSYNYGGGIRFFGGQRAGFRFDVRRVAFKDNGVDVKYYEAAVGMTIILGGAF